MKKLKGIKGVLIGVFVVAAALCVFAACSSDKDSADDTPITEMSLSIDNVKRTYLTYQSFSTDGLEATVKRESGNKETISAAYLDVDNSAFDNTTAGEYTIVVSYSEGGVTLSESYDVEVIEEIAGLSIEKTTVDYVIDSSSGVTIDLSDMKVYAVDDGGVSSTALSSGAYETRYYKGGEEIESLSNLGTGIYTIYAYRNVTIEGKYSTIDYECGAYVLCYVVHDTLTSITFKSGTTSQDMGVRDEMSGTWTFTITYQNGMTEEVTSESVSISGINTKEGTGEGQPGQATITYKEIYITSEKRETQEATVSVEYSIVQGEGQQAVEYNYSYTELLAAAGSAGGDAALQAEWFTGSNSFLTYVGTHGDNKIRPSTSNGIMQIRGDALEVTFKGFGSITIMFFSSGDDAESELGLKNSEKYFVKGTALGVATETQLSGDAGYCYVVKGGTGTNGGVTFDIEEPGTYTISVDITGDNSRGARIASISMTDVYYGEETENSAEVTALESDLIFEKVDLGMPGTLTEVKKSSEKEKIEN